MRFLLKQFLQLESSSGIILLIAALVALLWANSPLAPFHKQFIEAFLFLINEGLMAIFFLLVGLELKRSYLEDEMSQFSQVLLPAFAAVGGMLIPALIYWGVNYGDRVTMKGWATPVATDIAFALGVLSLFGRRVPDALKLFLMALAIFDDIGAIVIIAFFYSHKLSYLWLFQSAVLVGVLYLFNVVTIRSLIPYLLVGAWLWLCLLKSGVHPTVAGVLLALAIPEDGPRYSPLRRLENALHPWVAYLIMPLFALANAGFSFDELSWSSLLDKIVLGIMLGLFVGKQLGVFGFSWLLIRFRLARLPEKSTWAMLYGVSLLCGIGFTMSLFLGTLSFQKASYFLAEVRLGVALGSLLSGIFGALVLLISFAREQRSS
ncbi:Na+/H+ antiporter NhaA [Aquicella lusitana]|uniref:Na(+)/H(+) antiporter NhaA n=1 Tax=Aquicella lusitana TaxID=254246 RepID=A0A370GLQ3_9COXI|nr:Na+/H+ antiporter NhaA [Aquicella lusitana]RDI44601.1 sodium/proton antiporter (NhaA family) [Aquicella lusitana]VVC72457.1 Na(+)/H(+) antiporter NhaA [Aquicella lusitana]